MKEVSFSGSVKVNTDDDETAIEQALIFIAENPNDYCEVKEIKD